MRARVASQPSASAPRCARLSAHATLRTPLRARCTATPPVCAPSPSARLLCTPPLHLCTLHRCPALHCNSTAGGHRHRGGEAASLGAAGARIRREDLRGALQPAATRCSPRSSACNPLHSRAVSGLQPSALPPAILVAPGELARMHMYMCMCMRMCMSLLWLCLPGGLAHWRRHERPLRRRTHAGRPRSLGDAVPQVTFHPNPYPQP